MMSSQHACACMGPQPGHEYCPCIEQQMEADRLQRADADIENAIRLFATPSCGCIFCDLNIPKNEEGYHDGSDERIYTGRREVVRIRCPLGP